MYEPETNIQIRSASFLLDEKNFYEFFNYVFCKCVILLSRGNVGIIH